MRRWRWVAALLVLAGCNLSGDNPGPPADATATDGVITATPRVVEESPDVPTLLPGAATTPGVLPTRTPFGFSGPAPTAIGGPLRVPTSATGETGVIISPGNGSQIPVGTLTVTGVVGGLTRDQFTLVLQDSFGNILNSQLITLQNPNNAPEVPWTASMTTGPTTGPAEIRIVAQDPNGLDLVLARTAITLTASGASAPPPLARGNGTPQAIIASPAENAVVSGDVIEVNGTAGGIPGNQFVLVVVDPNGIALSSQVVTYSTSDPGLLVPWAASLAISGYRGPAEIRAFTMSVQTVLDTVQIQVQ